MQMESISFIFLPTVSTRIRFVANFEVELLYIRTDLQLDVCFDSNEMWQLFEVFVQWIIDHVFELFKHVSVNLEQF